MRYEAAQFKFGVVPSAVVTTNAAAASQAMNVEYFREKTVQIVATGGGSFSVDIEGSLDGGTTWAKIGASITATGLVLVSLYAVGKLRLNFTSVVGPAAVSGWFGGFDSRTE